MPNTLLNTNRTVSASSNPVANVQQVNSNIQNQQPQVTQGQVPTNTQTNAISPITIPIQIQPQVSSPNNIQPINNNIQQLQTNSANNSNNINTIAQSNNSNRQNVIDFDQIYSSYQKQFGIGNNDQNVSDGQIKKSSIGTTIITPTANLNTVKGQYQSTYADTFNSLLSTLIERMDSLDNGTFYDPTKDSALRVASEYAANSAMESMAGRGILNSSMTAERVSRVVSELIPQYEKLAYDRQFQLLGQLADTAQLVMDFDTQQFQYWKDAKDREFQEKEFAFQKQQQELENAWKRVDELGYVDNEASTLLGVKVGTLSKDAREAKEQREFELKKMQEQAELEYQNNKALYELRAQLDAEQAQKEFEYEKQLNQFKANLDSQQAQKEFEYEKQLKQLQSSLNNQSTEKEYKLAQQYSSKSTSSSSENYKDYDEIIQNSYAEYDSTTKQYIVPNQQKYNELTSYLDSLALNGQITPEEYSKLCAKYARSFETTDEKSTTNSDAKQNDSKTQEKKSPNLFSGSVSALGNILQNLFK